MIYFGDFSQAENTCLYSGTSPSASTSIRCDQGKFQLVLIKVFGDNFQNQKIIVRASNGSKLPKF